MLGSAKIYGLFSIMVGLLLVSVFSFPAMAAHPLITDDTATQGKGKFQIEFNSEFTSDKDTVEEVTTRQKGGEVSTIFSYGMTDRLDLVIGLPYQWSMVKENDEISSRENGLSDLSVEMKWRFWETKGLSFALKPGVTFPTGNDESGLGTGKVTGSFHFITTAEIEPWAFHFNAGYMRNENKLDERKDLWHLSLAAEVEVLKDLKLVGNLGVERSPDRHSNRHPSFILGGMIYSITEWLDVDLGIKGGLNDVETDFTFLAGLAVRF